MSELKNIEINDKYTLKHFIESTSFCDVYTAQENGSDRFVSVSVYKDKEIAKDDLDDNGNLREIGFLKLGIDGFPMLIGFGDFLHKTHIYHYEIGLTPRPRHRKRANCTSSFCAPCKAHRYVFPINCLIALRILGALRGAQKSSINLLPKIREHPTRNHDDDKPQRC